MHPFQVCKSITWLGTGQPTHGQDQGLIGEERGVEGVSLWQSMIGYIPHDLTLPIHSRPTSFIWLTLYPTVLVP